jgi:hypothetical protein
MHAHLRISAQWPDRMGRAAHRRGDTGDPGYPDPVARR